MYTLIKKTFHRVGKKLFVRNCVTSQGQTKYIKTIEDMAHPKSLPLLGTKLDLIFAGGGTKLHEYIDKRHKQLGPIFYEKLEGDTKLVFVSDPMLIKSVFLSLEGKYPAHILPEPWVLYEKFYGSKRGLFFMNGEEWLTNRRIMNKLLLREDSIKWIEEPVKNTVEKFVQYWKTEVKDGTVANLESDLYRLSTEVILSILIGTNSSLKYSAHYEELLTMLSETVKKIFQTTTKLFGLPLNLCLRLNLNVWRNFKESVDMSLLLAQKLVSEMLLKRDDNNGLVHKLLAENVSDNLIIRIVADFIIAAGDTTAYTSIWSLFLLAQNDEISHEIRTGNIGYVKNVRTNIPCNITSKRNFSFEGFVQWQGQTYASISNSSLVHLMQDGLLYVHDTTGLPWWATIITSTVLLRSFMTLPLTIYTNLILAKVENISLELKDLVEELKRETAMAKKMYKLTNKQAIILYKRSLKKQWRSLIVRDNCHPLKASLVMWVQIPIWVCMSFALRNLVNCPSGDPAALVTLMELAAGGIGWIPNLTEPDHSYILPVAFGMTNLAVIEIQKMSKLRQPSKIYNIFTNMFRVFSIIMIPVAASVPSCMCLYWVTSSSFGIVQNLCLLSPSLRRKLRIPEAPSELEQPYSHMKDEVRLLLQKITPKKYQ
ncbi:hypothetical protein MSG28_010330 [Choristoneura fumiferana]|uniref:Uncharacterized protein n=1 Tax=Choristoneura fumiferana TaxID=7141 RepID=A0ACC0KKD1_CHOFU|nr:hypothetical protein MSG28_010330 [Choristoneura fumiferana]